MSFDDWYSGVMSGIGAETCAANHDLVLHWAQFESTADVMRWNNPLNTTQKEHGSVDSGAQPGAHDVQKYPDLATGIKATITTLQNGHYPHIVEGFQQAAGPKWYLQNAASEFSTWGTGTSFLHNVPDHGSSGGQTPGPTPEPAPEPAPAPEPEPAPAHSGPTFPGQDITLHSSGSEVKTWQEQLNTHGHSLTVDGEFGPLTEEATKAFQSSKGLTTDGIVGPRTWAAAWS